MRSKSTVTHSYQGNDDVEAEDRFPKAMVWIVVAILAFVAFAWILPRALMPSGLSTLLRHPNCLFGFGPPFDPATAGPPA
jgi:hypothetical protein